MNEKNFWALREYVLEVLEKGLPRNLYYHRIGHTRDYVLSFAEVLGKSEGISNKDFLLLKTAALIHEVGFLEEYFDNEKIALKFAEDLLPRFGYLPYEVARIEEIIFATKLEEIDGKKVQNPDSQDILQKIICDADLGYLGERKFFVISENLKRELNEHGSHWDIPSWMEKSLEFQKNHSYFTHSARYLRENGKKENIKNLEGLIGLEDN